MKLKDICEINPRIQGIADYTLVSFVPMPCVSENGEIDPSDIRQFLDVKKGYTVFQENDVLFAKITPCMENGKGAIARGLMNGIGCGSSEFHVLRANKEMVCPEWIYYLSAWSRFRREAEKHMTGSAGQRRVPKAYLENYDVNVPSLPEQTKQIQVLSQLQQIIDCRKQELQKLDELVKARFVEMFGDPATNPMNWDRVNISEVVGGKVSNGFFAKRDDYVDDGNVSVMGVAYIVNRMYSQWQALPRTNGTEKDIEKFAVKYGDMLFCRSSLVAEGIGKASIVPEDVPEKTLFECHVIRLPLDLNKCVPEYMQVLSTTEFFRKQIIAQSKTATMTTIGQDGILKTDIILPPLGEQKEFYTFVKQVDKSKVVVQKALDEAQLLFDSLMQQYFG